jgi:hypothetical protein
MKYRIVKIYHGVTPIFSVEYSDPQTSPMWRREEYFFQEEQAREYIRLAKQDKLAEVIWSE